MSAGPAPAGARPTLLIAEDEPRIQAFLTSGLAAEGYDTTVVGSGTDVVAGVQESNPSLVLLDLGLPGMDGMEVLKHLRRRRPDLAVLVLSVRRDLATRVAALQMGARDYVNKPFSFDELLARIRIHLPEEQAPATDVQWVGRVSYNPRTREVDLGEGPIALSDRESELFEQLLRERGEVVSRERLLSAVWGYSFQPDTNIVDVYVKRLRMKLGTAMIETVRGAGYRLVA